MSFPRIRPFTSGPSTTFLWLFVVALLLTVSGTTKKHAVSSLVVRTAYAPFYTLNDAIGKLATVYRENNELLARVVKLSAENARFAEAARENRRLRALLGFRNRSQFRVIPAEVVGSPSVPVRGTIWISAGPGEMAQVGAPVVTPAGLVGNVAEISGGLAVVRSLWNRECRVAGLDSRSRAAGIVQWAAGPYLRFNYVPIDGDVAIGDTIISSGWGERYPEGLPVGEVREVEVDSTEFFLTISVDPFVRFEALEEVFVIDAPADSTTTEAGQ